MTRHVHTIQLANIEIWRLVSWEIQFDDGVMMTFRDAYKIVTYFRALGYINLDPILKWHKL